MSAGEDAQPTADPTIEPNVGGLEGDWFYEEDQQRTRLGIRVLEHLHGERSEFQKIDVYRSDFHGRFLTLDDLMMVTERDEFVYHEMLVHVPLCSLPAPRSVLIIGGGDCGCIREALKHDTVERVVQCEIDERVTRVSQEHFDWVEPTIADPRVELVFDDGVAYMQRNERQFDLVIVDSTDPIGPAVGLFLADFYEKAGRSLTEGGVLAAQTETPFWAPRALGAIHAQMRRAFAHVQGYWGSIPTYPSGSWTWAYATHGRKPFDHFAGERAEAIEAATKYWNRDVHRACFALPNFARQAIAGVDPFAGFRPNR